MQQKQFRIEKMLAGRRGFMPLDEPGADAVTAFKRNLACLVSDDEGRRLTRAAAELGAAVESMEKAAQVVLTAAESIDDGVRIIAGGDGVPEIRHRIAQLYEACNFQDLAGQRIGKVITLLAHLEDQLAHVVGDGGDVAMTMPDRRDGSLINGPRLDGAEGHVDQHDVDLLFG